MFLTYFIIQTWPLIANAKFGNNVPVIAGKVETKDKKGVNLRSCPDIACPIVDGLKEGKTYYFNLVAEGEWLNIKNAYAHRSFVKILNGAFVERKNPRLMSEAHVHYNIAKIFVDFGLNKNNKEIVFGKKNFIKMTEFNHVSPSVQKFKFRHKKQSYRGVLHKSNYYFTDGQKVYCAYYDSRPPRRGVVWNAKTKELESQLGDSVHAKKYFYGTYPQELYAYQISGDCLVKIFDSDFDLTTLADYQKNIVDGINEFVIPEKYTFEKVLKSEMGKIKESPEFVDIFNEDVVAIYKSKERHAKSYVHYKSPVKKTMVLKSIAPGVSLDIAYREFSVSHYGKAWYRDKKLDRWGGLYAHEDMEINGFKILKGEIINFADLISLIQISHIFKSLRKNIDFGFARTIDEKNFSVGQPLLFFDLSRIKLDTELYKISPHYVTSLKDFEGQLSLLPRIFGKPPEENVNREYSFANKFMNQRIGFQFTKSDDEHEHHYCRETYEGVQYFEKKLKEWGITGNKIDSIAYIKDDGLHELKLAESFQIEKLNLAPKSKLYIQKIPCENAMNIIYAIAESGSRWNNKELSKSYVKLENLSVLEVISDGKVVFEKHKSNLERALEADFKKFPLCVKNPLIKANPLKIGMCGYHIGDYGSPVFYEIENYNSISNEIVIQGHVYSTSDLIPLVTARSNGIEYWLPFVFDLYQFAYNENDELLNLVNNQQKYTLETGGDGYIRSGAGYYCDPSFSDRHVEPHERIQRPIFNGTFRVLDEAGPLEIKMNEHLTKFYNICEIDC